MCSDILYVLINVSPFSFLVLIPAMKAPCKCTFICTVKCLIKKMKVERACLNVSDYLFEQLGDMTSSSPQIKCLLVASLVFQGIPSLPIDCLSDKLLQSLVKSLTRIRSQYKDLIAPADFTSLRSFEWHGTTRGKI